jgi:hypothetical protein
LIQGSYEDEHWVPVPGFPRYVISNYGRVVNTYTEHFKQPYLNEQGNASVLLSNLRSRPMRRSLPLLVAKCFLPDPPRPDWDTPIHLDNDAMNNHVSNLAWRSRWFAVTYSMQFNRAPLYNLGLPIQHVESGRIYPNIRECAMAFGLLERDIFHSCHNGTPATPTFDHFQMVI